MNGCEHENPAGSRFCLTCGAPITIGCPACGAKLPSGARFCNQCGAALDGATAAGPGPATSAGAHPGSATSTDTGSTATSLASADAGVARPAAVSAAPAPTAYTPRHLAERILTSRRALEGERKQVTVLFADLKGSMELLADRDPEDARRILDPVIELMMEAVHRFDGTVNQVMGDGIMALFGAPLAHEDHAVRACYAALRMQDAIRHHAAGVWRAEGAHVQIRVGLNSGDVVVRSIGSDLRMDYTAVGQTTHLAARMEQMARPGSTLLTAATAALAEGFVLVESLGAVPVKGLAAPAEVFELAGASPVRSRLQAAAARGLTRFIGREPELQQLAQALDAARAGRGQVVAVVGEPGVGKSRLLWELTHSPRTQGTLVLEASSVSYGKATPYLPVIDLLRAYCRIEPRDAARAIREKVTGKVLSLDEGLRPALPALFALLDAATDDAGWAHLEPAQRRQRTLDAVRALLLRESAVQPLVVVFEDLHWIDGETQGFLDALVESLPTARVLLLVNYRPEYAHGWSGKTYYRQLRIDPLAAPSAEALLADVLGDDASVKPLGPLLIVRTEGNPFFLEESVRALVDARALHGSRGAYRLARPVGSLQLPATAQAVLAARIDRLAPEDKRLLQTAAVVGKDVPHALLAAVADLHDDALRAGLARLRASEFLYEARLFPDAEYTFKHALTHEVAYGELLHEQRRALHTRIAEAIEALHPDRLADQVELVAHHALRGEAWAKAVAYLRQAGRKGLDRSTHAAARCFEQALDALGHLPETPETIEWGLDIRLEMRAPLWSAGRFADTRQRLREAEPLAERLGDRRRLGWLLCFIGNSDWIVGAHIRALDAAEKAFAIADELGDRELAVMSGFYLGITAMSLGDLTRAEDCLRRNVAIAGDEVVPLPFNLPPIAAVQSRSQLSRSLAFRGAFDEGVAIARQALDAAERLGRAFDIAYACQALGAAHVSRGEPDVAVPVFERGLALVEAWGGGLLTGGIAVGLGYASVLIGRVERGLDLVRSAVDLTSPSANALQLALAGDAYLAAGRLEEAGRAAERALAVARERGERVNEAWALRLAADVAAARGGDGVGARDATGHGTTAADVDDAARAGIPPSADRRGLDGGDRPRVPHTEAAYLEALALAETLGLRPLVARCHLGLGQVYARSKRRDQAVQHLATARDLLAEMGIRYWLDRAQEEISRPG